MYTVIRNRWIAFISTAKVIHPNTLHGPYKPDDAVLMARMLNVAMHVYG